MTRSAGIDAVRVIGIVAIVAGHVWNGPLIQAGLYSWHVPLFFFLTGYLWTPGRRVSEELSRRSRTLLKPYIFWLAVLLIPLVLVKAVRGSLVWGDWFNPLWGNANNYSPFTTFWFVFALFSSALLWRVLEHVPAFVRVVVVAVSLVSSFTLGGALALTPLEIGAALPALTFVAAGQVARSLESRARRPLVWQAVCALALATMLIAIGLSAPIGAKQGNWGTPVLSMAVAVAISWALVVLVQRLYQNAPHWLSRLTTGVAKTGFTIVLLHPAILLGASAIGLPSILVFALGVTVPAIVGWLALHTRFSQWVTGISFQSQVGRTAASQ